MSRSELGENTDDRLPMKQPDLSVFKARLLELKSGLEGLDALSKSATATVVLDQSSVGRLSRMDALQGQQMALESERRRKLQLVQIEAALVRIANDDFGYCAFCGEDIPVGRLSINPVVTRCIKCAE